MATNPRLAGDAAAMGTSVVAFLVAGVLFIGSITAVLVTTRGSTSESDGAADRLEAVTYQIQASGLADLLLESPGYVGGSAFGIGLGATEVDYNGRITGADAVTRLGLIDPDSPERNMMDFAKFQNLRQAPLLADGTDEYINYYEALEQLGLADAGLNFHLRSEPSLTSVQEMLACKASGTTCRDSNLRAAYIGDAGTVGGSEDEEDVLDDLSGGLTLSPITCTVDNALYPRTFHIAATLTNAGDAATQFEGIFSLAFSNGDSEYHKVNTFWLANTPGSAVLFADAAYMTGRSCDDLDVNLKVYDPERMLIEVGHVDADLSGSVPSSASPRGLLLDTSSPFYRDGEDIRLDYTGKDLAEDDRLILTICPGESVCQVSDVLGLRVNILVPKQANKWFVEVDDALLPAGTYTARLYHNPTTSATSAIQAGTVFHATERLLVIGNSPAAEPGAYDPSAAPPPPASTPGNYDAGDQVSVEVSYLNDLLDKFCPFWYDSTTSSPITGETYDPRCLFKGGDDPHLADVYPQDKKTLKTALEARLLDGGDCDNDGNTVEPTICYTNLLVIGSNVDHNKMTSSDVKGTIGDWVLAGGTLVVFGSSEMSTHWLEAVFHVAIEEDNGNGVSVPDEGHPVLNVPNELNWPIYTSSYAWRLKVTGSFDAEAAFTRVVNENVANPNAILAVSDPGDFDAGSVILTGWTPWDLLQTGTGSIYEEGMALVHNLIMLGYRDLYLDYGPTLPNPANVVPEIRAVTICHPDFDDEATPLCDDPIQLTFKVYVFA